MLKLKFITSDEPYSPNDGSNDILQRRGAQKLDFLRGNSYLHFFKRRAIVYALLTTYGNFRSTTGWCATAHDNLLSWTSHRQPTVVAQSTSESEWHAAADAAKEAAYLKNLFYELNIDCPRTVPLKCDNQSTIKQSINQVDQRRCRHLGMRTHYLRQQCHSGNLELEYVPSAEQRGRIFTKCLYTPQHETLRSTLDA